MSSAPRRWLPPPPQAASARGMPRASSASHPRRVAHATPLALETLLGFAEVDVAARERLKDLDAIAGGGGRRRRTLVEPELGEQGVEAEPGGRIAHLQVVLELLHVAPGGEEHAQQLALVAAQGAELACLEVA